MLSLVVFVALLVASPALAAQKRLAFVLPEGTIMVGQRILRIYGIYFPPGNRICKSNFSPVRCCSRSAVLLDLRVDRFVTCNEVTLSYNRILCTAMD